MAGEERQHSLWEHGPEISKALKNVQIDGLTGVIRSVGLSMEGAKISKIFGQN
jgi:hypothetical protein